jgi:hypothetical protein
MVEIRTHSMAMVKHPGRDNVNIIESSHVDELIGAYALLDQGSLVCDFISSRILFDLNRMMQNKCNTLLVVDRPYTAA